ncbi:MAG: alpha/beta hydrolase [Pseudomonas sp.]|uniref:alpha/beta fold hydrolase n=1 Tax=Pseudomonas sp. TaxID=306 RepID=UPI003242527E
MLHTTLSGDGPTLVWAHGLMHSTEFESRTGWFHPDQPDPLRRVRFDARGHGRSPGSIDPADYLWSSQAGDLLSLADAEATGLYALGGHSMGSASALLAALRAPEKVSCLVLATPPTAWHTRPAQVRRYRQMQRIIQQRGLASLVSLAAQNPALPAWLLAARPGDAAASLDALAQMHADDLLAILDAACQCDLPPAAALEQLQIPTLILAWRDDPIHPLETAQRLAAALPLAELQVIDDVNALHAWPASISYFVLRHAADYSRL